MIVISNKTRDIQLPYQEGLLEWLQEHYPASKYHLVELA
jgi:hypothetical protein